MNTKQKLDIAKQGLNDIASGKYTKLTCEAIAKNTLLKLMTEDVQDHAHEIVYNLEQEAKKAKKKPKIEAK